MEIGLLLALGGAALAVFLAGIGSAVGIGLAGQAADGVLSEQPDRFGSLFMLVVLPGTQGFYGFVAGLLVMLKVGVFSSEAVEVTTIQGWTLLLGCLPVAFAGLVSGIHQGKVSAAGVAVAAKHPGDFMKAVMMSALVETYALLGLLATLFVWLSVKIGG